MKKVLLTITALLLASCATNMKVYQTNSAAATGCAPENIEIFDLDKGMQDTWKAKCDGIVYYCSGSFRSGPSCTKAKK